MRRQNQAGDFARNFNNQRNYNPENNDRRNETFFRNNCSNYGDPIRIFDENNARRNETFFSNNQREDYLPGFNNPSNLFGGNAARRTETFFRNNEVFRDFEEAAPNSHFYRSNMFYDEFSNRNGDVFPNLNEGITPPLCPINNHRYDRSSRDFISNQGNKFIHPKRLRRPFSREVSNRNWYELNSSEENLDNFRCERGICSNGNFDNVLLHENVSDEDSAQATNIWDEVVEASTSFHNMRIKASQLTFEDYIRKKGHKTDSCFKKVQEKKCDLLKMPGDYSLAHWLTVEMNEEPEIILQFWRNFNQLTELLPESINHGGVTYCNDNDQNIYYLILKPCSNKLQTLNTIFKSIVKLKQHLLENKVSKLAMSRVDERCWVEWKDLKFMLEYIFADTNVEITICNLENVVPRDGDLCVICYERSKTHAVIPCGHLILCGVCTQVMTERNLRSCPVCRQDWVFITHIIK